MPMDMRATLLKEVRYIHVHGIVASFDPFSIVSLVSHILTIIVIWINTAPNGYAYGMGGMEKLAYDSKEKILYGVSEQGFVSSLWIQ